jgi:hypothetical protein
MTAARNVDDARRVDVVIDKPTYPENVFYPSARPSHKQWLAIRSEVNKCRFGLCANWSRVYHILFTYTSADRYHGRRT